MTKINSFLVLLIKALRPFLGPYPYGSCRYYQTCTNYAISILEKENIIIAIFKIILRIITCGPLTPKSFIQKTNLKELEL